MLSYVIIGCALHGVRLATAQLLCFRDGGGVLRYRGGGDAMAPKKKPTPPAITDDPDFCKHLKVPFVVDCRACNYPTKKCTPGRALVQWDFDEQKPKANDAGVNGWANVLKTYEGGPPTWGDSFPCLQSDTLQSHVHIGD